IIYCESGLLTVRALAGGRIRQLPGYTRGLCCIGNDLYVGTSSRRSISKSTGANVDPGPADGPPDRCTISRLALESFTVEDCTDLSARGQEIYDLLPVAGVAGWPMVSDPDYFPMNALVRCIPPGAAFILVDEDQWAADTMLAGRCRLPFVEREGQYWGPPADDGAAIKELERLCASGAGFLVFAWPAFWWLDY